MAWRQTITIWIADVLRLLIHGALLVDGIIVAFFSTWFCYRCAVQLMDWLDRTLFS